MALILPFGEHRPRIGRGAFIAPNATLIGDVVIDEEASVWFGAVLRGDIGSIRIGARTNIQDLVCVHLTEGLSHTAIGADVTVGHGAILHGCIVGDRCLVGMGSVLLDNVEVGEESVIAAGSVVPPKMVIPPRSIVRGTPARVIRKVTPEEAQMAINGAAHYREGARKYLAICGGADASAARDRGSPARFEVDEEMIERRERALDLGSDREANED